MFEMKFPILLAFVITFPSILTAQDYDEAFLDSLPEEIRADLLDRADERDALEAPVYRSSYVMKPEEEIDDDLFGHKRGIFFHDPRGDKRDQPCTPKTRDCINRLFVDNCQYWCSQE